MLSEGEACWCSLVRLELWNGAQARREGAVLRDLERALPELKIDDDVGDNSSRYGYIDRRMRAPSRCGY